MNSRKCSFQYCLRNAELKCICTSSPTFLCEQHAPDHIQLPGGGHRIVPFSASDDWIANQNHISLLNNAKSSIQSAKQKSINATSGIIIKLEKALKYYLSSSDSQLDSLDDHLSQLSADNSVSDRHSKHRMSADKIERCCISTNEKLDKLEGFCKLLDCVGKFIENINFDDLQINEISSGLQREINKIRGHKSDEQGKSTEELEKWNKFIESWNWDTENYEAFNSFWYFKQGMLKYHCGKWNEALSSFSLAIKLQPDYLDAIFYRGLSLAKLQKSGSAIECWDSLIKIDPSFSIPYVMKALEKQSQNRFQESIESYNQLLNIGLENNILRFLKLDALLEKKSYKKALSLSNKIIEDCPMFSFAYGHRGSALNRLGDGNEAWKCYDKAIQMDQNYHPEYFQFACILLEQESIEDALPYLDIAIRISPYEKQYYHKKGEIHEKINNIKEAINCLEKIIEIDPASDWVYNHIGELLLKHNKFSESIEYFNKSIKFKPTLASAYVGKGNALFRSNNKSEALKAYKEALLIDHKLADVCLKIGNIYFEEKNYKSSKRYYDKAIKIDPKNANAYANKGLVLKLENKIEDAKDCLFIAISLDSNNHFAHFQLGKILYDEGQHWDSINHFDIAIRNNAINPEYYEAKGKALKVVGKDTESLECLYEATRLKSGRR
ncbi:unnamed protein product [Blepharisma stoltei]|uniref:Tetratricopeptide repeat protein n=1 Tax=Blepharisma stoltei TaxID=1481888 RepID=A0AAU9JFM9_9CILI|nr:unnamed protein product [Blepharisma stoltei]